MMAITSGRSFYPLMTPRTRVCCLFLLTLCVHARAEANRPNILLVFVDDHAYQAISAYGSQLIKTPNIDRLAVEGMRFDNCYVTNSICGPSRATVLTGKYSHKNGIYVNGPPPFDGSQVTFPKLLQAAGYDTAVIGKWHLGSPPTGFDHWQVLIDQGPYYNPPMLVRGKGDEPVQHVGYTTEIITDLALEWLRQGRHPDKPFMLMLQYKAPHRNWQPGPDHLTRFDDRDLPEPPSFLRTIRGRGQAVQHQDMSIEKTLGDKDNKMTPPENLNPAQLEKWKTAYEPKNRAFRKANLPVAI